MPINFHCTKCKGLLSVPEEIAGHPALCPYCQEVQTVPEESVYVAFSPGQQGAEMPPFQYQTPPAKLSQVEPSEPVMSKIRFSELFEKTWNIYTKTFSKQILFGLIVWGICMVAGMFIYFMTLFASFFLILPMSAMSEIQPHRQAVAPPMFDYPQYNVEIVKSEKEDEDVAEEYLSEEPEHSAPFAGNATPDGLIFEDRTDEEGANISPFVQDFHHRANQPPVSVATVLIIVGCLVGVLLLFLMVFSLVYLWLYAGQTRFMLSLVRGNDPSLSVIFSGWPFFGRYVYVAAFIGIAIMLVLTAIFMVTILPGIYSLVSINGEPGIGNGIGFIAILFGSFLMILVSWIISLFYGFSYFFVVDCDSEAGESLKLSRRYVAHNFWTILGAILVLTLIVGGVSMIPFGQLFTVPFMICFMSVLYLKMTGQPTAE